MRPQLENPTPWRPSALGLLAALAVGLAGYWYFAGEAATLPVILLPKLTETPLLLEKLRLGGFTLPIQVSGLVVSLTHDVAGPFAQGTAAATFLVLLGVALAGWLAVASTLERTPFLVGTVPVIFLLLSLNTETLGVFGSDQRYFLYLALALLVGTAFGLQAFAEGLRRPGRWLVFGGLVGGLSTLLFAQSQLPPLETTLQLAAFATPAGAVLMALLVLWVGLENVRLLLWFNAQADEPGNRFGLLPFVAAALFYLAALAAFVWNGELRLWPGLGLDPLVLLLPAVLTAGLGLPLRAPTYRRFVPVAAARQLYPLVLMAAAGELSYALATANTPLLEATREFTALALLALGGAFLLYVLANFLPLIRQRLRVYRVVFEPRGLPFYVVYVLAGGVLLAVQVRNSFPWGRQVQAATYNHLGDLTRLQSEAHPDDFALGLLAERYYAESGDVLDRNNVHAQFGRAALYRFRLERRNEMRALRRALQPRPNAKISLRLASLYRDPADIFDGLDVLRQGLKGTPHSAPLANDLAQLFTQTTVTDSVTYYLGRAEQAEPTSYANRTNQLAFLLAQKLLPAAAELHFIAKAPATEPALASNLLLLQLLQGASTAASPAVSPADYASQPALQADGFAAVYHAALAATQRRSAAWLPTLARLSERPANAPYYEQLLFLQALTHHAVGHEHLARQLLAPLTAGTSAGATYYCQLLAIWQAQQGQYRTAAEQLAGTAKPDSTLLTALQGLAREQPALPRPAVGTAWLAQARAAEAAHPAEAAKRYQRIVREAPFHETAIRAAAAFYSRRQDFTAAYAALQAGLAENPTSPALLQAYVLAAADVGLPDYASAALTQLQAVLPPLGFQKLAADFVAHRAARARAAASFQ